MRHRSRSDYDAEELVAILPRWPPAPGVQSDAGRVCCRWCDVRTMCKAAGEDDAQGHGELRRRWR
jgi:hypothetical protein